MGEGALPPLVLATSEFHSAALNPPLLLAAAPVLVVVAVVLFLSSGRTVVTACPV
jgi:hypothetical protein